MKSSDAPVYRKKIVSTNTIAQAGQVTRAARSPSSSAYFLSRCHHSITNRKAIASPAYATVVNNPIDRNTGNGLVNSDRDAISVITFHAPPIVGERKKIQANAVSANVKRIRKVTVGTRTSQLGEWAADANGSPMNTRGITYRPLRTPQTTKVQFAPCHNPLSVNVTSKLNACRPLDVRLPPRGM